MTDRDRLEEIKKRYEDVAQWSDVYWLIAALEEARLDSKRLDWIEEGNGVSWSWSSKGKRIFLVDGIMPKQSARIAIDEAMRQSERGEGR